MTGNYGWAIIVLMLVVLFSTVPLFMVVDKTFLPYDDEGQFAITMRAPEGASVATTQQIAESIATRTRQLEGVVNTVVTIGDDPQQIGAHLSQIIVCDKGHQSRAQRIGHRKGRKDAKQRRLFAGR